jgi:diadenylate cyclase
VVGNSASVLAFLERLAPGSPLRTGIERIIQANKGALIVIGSSPEVDEISSGGFGLQRASFSPARLAELAKMDGGIVLSSDLSTIFSANVHFVPDASYPTDETGSRHRTAERIALQTGKPVVAVSEGRQIAVLYFDGQKFELPSPAAIAARVNQELQNLDRLRRQLDEAETLLTNLEVSGMATYRAVVALLQRTELVRRVGRAIERMSVTLGEEGRLATVQLADLLRGVNHVRDLTLADYLPSKLRSTQGEITQTLNAFSDTDLVEPMAVGKVMSFKDLDAPVAPRGYRVLSKAGRIPEQVREAAVSHFRTFEALIVAKVEELEEVDGVGSVRARQLRYYFDRLIVAAETWSPQGL